MLTTPEIAAYTFAIGIPDAVSISDIALGTSNSMAIRNNVKIQTKNGVPASVANLGAGELFFGTDALVGTSWAKGNVFFSERSKVSGDLSVTGTVIKQNNDPTIQYVLGTTNPGPIATQVVPWTVPWPSAGTGNVAPEPQGSTIVNQDAAPGSYANVVVKPGTRVRLRTGTYFIESLDVQSSGHLEVDQTAGPVFVYVRSSLAFKGVFESAGGVDTDFFLGYRGSNAAFIEGAFVGTIVAPDAQVTLARAPAAHRGSFFAKSLDVAADAQFVFVPFSGWLIGEVTVSDSSPCSNESVEISVDAGSAGTDMAPMVTINGMPGTRQILQLPSKSTGVQRIPIVATLPNGMASYRSVLLDVEDCSATHEPFPVIGFSSSPVAEGTADIVVRNAGELERDDPTYYWTFGDGQTATTETPYVAHDFQPFLDEESEWQLFDVMVRVVESGKSDLTATKTVPVFNAYASNKLHGYLTPQTGVGGAMSRAADGAWSGELTVSNRENVAVEFTERVVELLPCDPTAGPVLQPAEMISLAVAAQSTTTYSVSLPGDIATDAVCGVGVHLSGKFGELKLAASQYLRTNRRRGNTVTDPAVTSILKKISDEDLVADPNHITLADLHRLEMEGKIPEHVPTSTTSYQASGTATQIGDECMPGETPTRPGVECVPASDLNGDPEYASDEIWILNATKGDAVLSRACSMVGELLKPLGKAWSHTGIIVHNHVGIRHSTAASDRYYADENLQKNSLGVVKGIKENVLRYGWPGSITQSANNTYFSNQRMEDPEHPGTFCTIEAFEHRVARCGSDEPVVYPYVLRSDPKLGAAGRVPLYQAADAALADTTPESHYRFYSYSRAEAAADAIAASAAWASGTNGTMCSGYVWNAFRTAGVTLEGTKREAFDTMPTANPGVDGLYLYTAGQRAAAGRALYDLLMEKVAEQDPINTESDHNLSNQVVNCFGKDDCQVNPDEDDAWQDNQDEFGEGETVAPDDMRDWDVYGYAQPAVFQFEYNRVYRWAPAAGTAEVTGIVVEDNGVTPIPFAELSLNGVPGTGLADGTFTFQGIPIATNNSLIGSAWVGVGTQLQLYLGRKNSLSLVPGPNGPVALILYPDLEYRNLGVSGGYWILDDEDFGDERCPDSGTNSIGDNIKIPLNPGEQDGEWSDYWCCHREVRSRLKVSGKYLNDGILHVKVRLELWEDDECNFDDPDGTKSWEGDVNPDEIVPVSLVAKNDDDWEWGVDKTGVDIFLSNLVGNVWPTP